MAKSPRVALVSIDPVWEDPSGDFTPFTYGVRKLEASILSDPTLSDVEVRVIDLRTRDEFGKGHIDGAVNIPLHHLLDPGTLDRFQDAETTYVLYGEDISAGARACALLRQLGLSNIQALQGCYGTYTSGVPSPVAEAAAFELGEFPASAIALEPSEVAFFPRGEFLELIREHPMISLKVISGLSRWIREFMERIEDLATKDVSARLARFLIEASQSAGSSTVELEIPKSELAASLGTVGETLSRALRRFRESGWIEVDGSRIEILDFRELRALGAVEG